MAVDRCICHQVTFTDLKRLHEVDGLSFEQLQERTGCATGCGMCEAYIRKMFVTGEADQPIMSAQEADAVLRAAREWMLANR